MRDLALRDQDEGPVTVEEKNDWKSKARAFLRYESDADKKTSGKHKKQRLPAYDHLIAADHLLMALTGKGLQQFKLQEPSVMTALLWTSHVFCVKCCLLLHCA